MKTVAEVVKTAEEIREFISDLLSPFLNHKGTTERLIAIRGQRALLMGMAEMQFAMNNVQLLRAMADVRRSQAKAELASNPDPLERKWPEETTWVHEDELSFAVPAKEEPKPKKGKK